MEKHIRLPLTKEISMTLNAGDAVYLTGDIYTSRDAGHKRMCEALSRGEKLPFDPMDATIYYVGPTPAKPGQVIGSAGPTTSGRMDAYAPTMISAGARGMIGKGERLPEVIEAIKKYSGAYFGAIGGAGALLAKCVKKSELVAYEDLGAEALRKLYVEDMPLVVIIDHNGQNFYESGRREYLKTHNQARQHQARCPQAG
jgi:fumarate hydratase subunit beta